MDQALFSGLNVVMQDLPPYPLSFNQLLIEKQSDADLFLDTETGLTRTP